MGNDEVERTKAKGRIEAGTDTHKSTSGVKPTRCACKSYGNFCCFVQKSDRAAIPSGKVEGELSAVTQGLT